MRPVGNHLQYSNLNWGKLSNVKPSKHRTISPNLIDFGQSASCFTLNIEGTHIADYPFPGNGKTKTISLLCGTDAYGYKHITTGHKADWVATQINAHDDTGNSWDDLMSFAVFASLNSPNWISGPTNGKFCADAAVEFYDKNGAPTYYQRVMTIWSDTNKTVITAYPITTGSLGCR